MWKRIFGFLQGLLGAIPAVTATTASTVTSAKGKAKKWLIVTLLLLLLVFPFLIWFGINAWNAALTHRIPVTPNTTTTPSVSGPVTQKAEPVTLEQLKSVSDKAYAAEASAAAAAREVADLKARVAALEEALKKD
jgi:cytoskeletal protein RodZ